MGSDNKVCWHGLQSPAEQSRRPNAAVFISIFFIESPPTISQLKVAMYNYLYKLTWPTTQRPVFRKSNCVNWICQLLTEEGLRKWWGKQIAMLGQLVWKTKQANKANQSRLSCLKERGTTFEKDCNLSSLESSSGIKRLNINESCQQAFLASNLNLTPY